MENINRPIPPPRIQRYAGLHSLHPQSPQFRFNLRGQFPNQMHLFRPRLLGMEDKEYFINLHTQRKMHFQTHMIANHTPPHVNQPCSQQTHMNLQLLINHSQPTPVLNNEQQDIQQQQQKSQKHQRPQVQPKPQKQSQQGKVNSVRHSDSSIVDKDILPKVSSQESLYSKKPPLKHIYSEKPSLKCILPERSSDMPNVIDGTEKMLPVPTEKLNLTIVCGTPASDTSSDELSSKEQTTGMSEQNLNGQPPLNQKKKTSMCLVNELARYNKIEPLYSLIDERGPAHAKRFTVALKLGNEEYIAEGPSIKKGQHSTAAAAITQTKYDHPPVKTRSQNRGTVAVITPTVKLNALAMKMGTTPVYVLNSQQQQQQHDNGPGSRSTNMHQQGQRYNQPRTSFAVDEYRKINNRRVHQTKLHVPMPYNTGSEKEMFEVTLILKDHQFTGVGVTPQAARHNAAAQALQVLEKTFTPDESNDATLDDQNAELKSPISLVYEIALKRNLPILFKVLSERGPPHMKTFVTLCQVGELKTTGEGNGKKISKKSAAKKMLEELKKLPPLTSNYPAVQNHKNKTLLHRKRTRNIVRDVSESNSGNVFNPVSKLIEIQQALKEREPVYSVIEQKAARQQEFVIEVSAGGNVARGSGPNKKVAKRRAAQNLLEMMKCDSTGPNKENISTMANSRPNTNENVNSCSTSSQAPFELGVAAKPRKELKLHSRINQNNSSNVKSVELNLTPPGEEANVDASQSNKECNSSVPKGVRPTDQLNYLAKVLGFEVEFSYYPKGGHSEYLTIVTLSTVPPQIFHGTGNDFETSQDNASKRALETLGTTNNEPSSNSKNKENNSLLSNDI